MTDLEKIKWFLDELANADGDDIESNELEIYGETEQGLEGSFTEQITKIAEKALKEIEQLEKDKADLEEKLERRRVAQIKAYATIKELAQALDNAAENLRRWAGYDSKIAKQHKALASKHIKQD